MTGVFRVRLDRELVRQANEVAEEIGTLPSEGVRMMSRQKAERRAIPFPLQADAPENEVLTPARRRSQMWDAMNEGRL